MSLPHQRYFIFYIGKKQLVGDGIWLFFDMKIEICLDLTDDFKTKWSTLQPKERLKCFLTQPIRKTLLG